MDHYIVDGFLSYTIGILVFFIGVNLTRSIPTLRKYHIPEPVTGGLIAAVGDICHLLLDRHRGKL